MTLQHSSGNDVLCRNCRQAYLQDQYSLNTGRYHIMIQADAEYCRKCCKAYLKGAGMIAAVWLATGMIWWGLHIIGVVA